MRNQANEMAVIFVMFTNYFFGFMHFLNTSVVEIIAESLYDSSSNFGLKYRLLLDKLKKEL